MIITKRRVTLLITTGILACAVTLLCCLTSPTSAMAAAQPWVTVDSGIVDVTITDNETLTVTKSMSYTIQRGPSNGIGIDGQPMYSYRTNLTIDLSDLVAQGYTGFACSAIRASAGSGSWIVTSVSSKAQLDGLTFTCEKVWEEVPLPEPPPKEGYTFIGWFLDSECTQRYEGETVRDDIQLYAGYRINVYTVTLNVDGGTAVDNIQAEYNSMPRLPSPTRVGYNFLGWYTTDGQLFEAGAKITGDVMLTAHWEIKTYLVTFYVDGEVYKTVRVNYGTSLVEAVEQAALQTYNLMAYTGMAVIEGSTVPVIVDDAAITVAEATGADKVAKTVKANWPAIVISIVGGVLVIGVIASLIGRKDRSRR